MQSKNQNKMTGQPTGEHITSEIQKIDDTLSILRESWMDAGEDKKAKWMKMIDDQLDQRFKLMGIRDNMG
jgi:hypothetical protein